MSEYKSYAHLQCLLCRAVVKLPVEDALSCPADLFGSVDLSNYSHNCSRNRPVTSSDNPRPNHLNRGVFRYAGFSGIPGIPVHPVDVVDHTVAEKPADGTE